jgi:hypothetical protein
VEPNQVDLVAAAVLRGLEQVVHATEARLARHNNERAAAHAAWQLNPFAMSDTLSIAVAQLNPTVGDIQGISHSAFATNILRRNIVEPG